LQPFDAEKPYFVEIRCNVRQNLVAMSSVYEMKPLQRPSFGMDCSENDNLGVFCEPDFWSEYHAPPQWVRPTTLVPGAGCARFWIEFHFGKWLHPLIKGGDLRVLNPQVLAVAHRWFSTSFLQGCSQF
jgi:hypothetical protein